METDDPFKTSNPAQKRSIVDDDPNYGTLITPKSKPKPMPKASPKTQPAIDPSASASSASASASAPTVEPASPAIQANILPSSAGSTKDKTYKKRYWQDKHIDELQAKVKQLGINLTKEQLAEKGKNRYPKAKLVSIIMEHFKSTP